VAPISFLGLDQGFQSEAFVLKAGGGKCPGHTSHSQHKPVPRQLDRFGESAGDADGPGDVTTALHLLRSTGDV
jgi:hypothetical protein